MVSNKVAAISIIVGVLIGFELNQFYVPADFQSPLRFKFFASMFKLFSGTAKLGESLGLGQEATLLRLFANSGGNFINLNDNAVTTSEIIVDGVNVRLYMPKSAQENDKLPIMVYFHGGGYAFGAPKSYDNYLFEFVKKLNLVIVSVDYRMAPENPYPAPTDDCYRVTKHVIQNPAKFNADVSRLVIAGDSAGGDAAIVVMTKIIKEKLQKPKIQVLIYPWLQKFYTKFPSQARYGLTGIIGSAKMTLSKFGSWYLGITNITEELTQVYREAEILGLIENESDRKFIMDSIDVNKIPVEYKPDESYYKTQSKVVIPKLKETSLLKRDPELAKKLKQLFDPEVSPLLTPKEILAEMPKTHLTVYEWDSLKDENLLYAERLREAGVDLELAFYKEAFHGMGCLTQNLLGFQKARDIRNELINYLLKNL